MGFKHSGVDLARVGCRGDSKIAGYCLGGPNLAVVMGCVGGFSLMDAKREE